MPSMCNNINHHTNWFSHCIRYIVAPVPRKVYSKLLNQKCIAKRKSVYKISNIRQKIDIHNLSKRFLLLHLELTLILAPPHSYSENHSKLSVPTLRIRIGFFTWTIKISSSLSEKNTTFLEQKLCQTSLLFLLSSMQSSICIINGNK